MLQAAIFPDFKGADTLLLWGESSDIRELHEGLADVQYGRLTAFEVAGNREFNKLLIRPSIREHESEIVGTAEAVTWSCSKDVLRHCLALIVRLLNVNDGHQYVAAQGALAEQVLISVNEYPQDYQLET